MDFVAVAVVVHGLDGVCLNRKGALLNSFPQFITKMDAFWRGRSEFRITTLVTRRWYGFGELDVLRILVWYSYSARKSCSCTLLNV